MDHPQRHGSVIRAIALALLFVLTLSFGWSVADAMQAGSPQGAAVVSMGSADPARIDGPALEAAETPFDRFCLPRSPVVQTSLQALVEPPVPQPPVSKAIAVDAMPVLPVSASAPDWLFPSPLPPGSGFDGPRTPTGPPSV